MADSKQVQQSEDSGFETTIEQLYSSILQGRVGYGRGYVGLAFILVLYTSRMQCWCILTKCQCALLPAMLFFQVQNEEENTRNQRKDQKRAGEEEKRHDDLWLYIINISYYDIVEKKSEYASQNYKACHT